MIKGNVEQIMDSLYDLTYGSLTKAHIGEFNVDLNSVSNARLKGLLETASKEISQNIIELQATADNEMTYVTGSLNKKLVNDMAKAYVFEFFRATIGCHHTYANSKTRDFVRDFNFKISQLGRKWKAGIPKKTKRPRKISKL